MIMMQQSYPQFCPNLDAVTGRLSQVSTDCRRSEKKIVFARTWIFVVRFPLISEYILMCLYMKLSSPRSRPQIPNPWPRPCPHPQFQISYLVICTLMEPCSTGTAQQQSVNIFVAVKDRPAQHPDSLIITSLSLHFRCYVMNMNLTFLTE